MPISIRLPAAATGAALLLLSACGGGTVDGTAPPAPAPVPSPPSPTPTTDKNYQIVYLSPARGIVTVLANELQTSTVSSAAQPLLTAYTSSGTFSNGMVRNGVPAGLVFLDGNQWKRLSLLNGESQLVSNLAITENRIVCQSSGAFVIADYVAPQSSLVMYTVAGADNSCSTEDDLYTGFALGGNSVVNFGSNPSIRQFRNGNGAVTGYLVQVGGELRLYGPNATSFRTVASGIVGFVGSGASFARTNTAAWLRWDNGSVKAIYRVDADGTVSAPLYSVPRAETLGGGISDPDAMYVVHRTASSSGMTEIVRVPFNGGGNTVLATVAGSAAVNAISSSTLLLQNTTSNPDVFAIQVLPKTGGTPVTATTTGVDRFGVVPLTVTTSANQFLLTTYSGTTSSALLINAAGQIVENLANSEWIGNVIGSDFSADRQMTALYGQAVRVESYPGPYASVGHQGGTIVVRNFNNNTRAAVAQVSGAGAFSASAIGATPGLAAFTTTDGNNTELFGYDLDTLKFTQVTNTPSIRETTP